MQQTRRQFLKYGVGAGAAVVLADPAVRVAYKLAGVRRVLPPKPLIPPVAAHSGDVISLKPLLVYPESSEIGYVPVDKLKRTKLGQQKEAEGYVIKDEFDGTDEFAFTRSKFSVPYNGQAFFRGGVDVESSRLYLLYNWISEKKERRGNVINAYFDTKHDAGKKIQKDDLGILVRINKTGKKESLFAYGGMNTQYGFPDDWVKAPATVNWSCGLGTSPHSASAEDRQMVFKLDAPLTLTNPEKVEVEGMQLYVGNLVTNEWLTVFSDGADPTTWHNTSLPTGFPYVGEKIDISPALIVQDSSTPEIATGSKVKLTSLGKRLMEEKGWQYESELTDTEGREVKLLENGYNKTPNGGDARARVKANYDAQTLDGIVLCPSLKELPRDIGLLLLIDTKYQNDYQPQQHDLLFNMYYDSAGKSKTAFAKGIGTDWPRVYGQVPSGIVSSTGIATNPSSGDKELIFKFSIPQTIANPNMLPVERMAIILGSDVTGTYVSAPRNESWKTSYTWADAFHLGETMAVGELGEVELLGLGTVDIKNFIWPTVAGFSLLALKRMRPKTHAQVIHATRELSSLVAAMYGNQ